MVTAGSDEAVALEVGLLVSRGLYLASQSCRLRTLFGHDKSVQIFVKTLSQKETLARAFVYACTLA